MPSPWVVREERAARFREASKPLAESLGQLPAPLQIAPGLAPGIIEDDDRVPSLSRPGFYYRLVRSASGWQHANTDCRGWLIHGNCHHVQEKNGMTTQALVPSTFAMAVFDDAEDAEIVGALQGQVTKSWIYEFQMGGTSVRGISAVGVEEASGEMAKHGEALRVLDIKIEYEDEKEARFIVQSGRFAISGDGREQLLDVTIRGKRQSKLMKLRNGGTQDDEHWYEKGVTKAVRNAKLAQMPEYAKTYILAEAVKAGKVRQVQPAQPRTALPPAGIDTETGEILDPPAMASAEQQARIKKLWDPRGPKAPVIRERYSRAFPQPGTGGVNSPKLLSAADADDVIALLEKPEVPASATSGTVAANNAVDTPPAQQPCVEHDAYYPDGTDVLHCRRCGAALEGPDAVQPSMLSG